MKTEVYMVQHVYECDPDEIGLFFSREKAIDYIFYGFGEDSHAWDECDKLVVEKNKLNDGELITDEDYKFISSYVFKNCKILIGTKEIK